jgi:hypothetical protein
MTNRLNKYSDCNRYLRIDQEVDSINGVVRGEAVNVFGATITRKDLDDLLNTMHDSKRLPFRISISNDNDNLSDSRSSWFFVMSFCSAAFALICLIDSILITYRVLLLHINNGFSVLSFRTLSATVNILGNICRIIVFYDLTGVSFIISKLRSFLY